MAQSTTAPTTVTDEWVEKFVERWLAAWNSRQPERVLELMTDDVVYDDSASPRTMRGHAQTREFLERVWQTFPDFTVELVSRPLAGSDAPRGAFRWRAHGTNDGELAEGVPATGKRVEWQGADFHEYRDGKVARLEILFDMADAFRQMGLLPHAAGVE